MQASERKGTKYLKKLLSLLLSFLLVLPSFSFIATPAIASTHSVTWTTKEDFESNAVTTGKSSTKIGVDTFSSPGSVSLLNEIDFNRPTVAAGYFHNVGLKEDGTVVAVGNNSSGQLNVSSWRNIKAVAAGYDNTIGLKEDGTVVAAGANWLGQSDVSSWRNIKAIAAGAYHTVGLKEDGTVVATGADIGEIYGTGQTNVSSWSNVKAIAAGHEYTIGLKEDGTWLTAGYHYFGETNVSNWTNIKQVVAGIYHTVGLKEDGTAVAKGCNYDSRLNVSDWRNIRAIAAGGRHTVGLREDGRAVAVGENSYGQTDVSSWTNIRAVAAGTWHTVGLKEDGTAVAIGGGDVSSWQNIKQPAYHLASSGKLLNLKINLGEGLKPKWKDISWDASIPPGTSLKFKTRGADRESELSSALWSNYYTVSGSSITTPASEWLEVELTMESYNGVSTPLVNDLTVGYDLINEPSGIAQYSGMEKVPISPGAVSSDIVEVRVLMEGLTDSSFLTPQIELKEIDKPFNLKNIISGNPVSFSGGPTKGTISILSGLAEGRSYHYRVRVKDNKGRVSPWSEYNGGGIAFKVDDLEAPSFSYVSLANNSFIKGRTKLKGYATDNYGIGIVQYFNSKTNPAGFIGQSSVSQSYIVYWDTKKYRNGRHTLFIKAIDKAGNSSLVSRSTIIDNYKPRTYAPFKVIAKRGRRVRIPYKIKDPYSPVYVVIKVKKGRRIVKTLRAQWKKAGTINYIRYRIRHSKGRYRFFIYAKDKAGNTQYNIAKNYLVVK